MLRITARKPRGALHHHYAITNARGNGATAEFSTLAAAVAYAKKFGGATITKQARAAHYAQCQRAAQNGWPMPPFVCLP